jgi:dipeptidyl aminopeptidase/acylaminoacyl peptidase
VATRQAWGTLQGHTSKVHAVAFSPDGKILATGSKHGAVKLWDTGPGRVRVALQGHTSEVYSAVFSPDGETLASGSGDETVKLWDVATGHVRATLTGHNSGVSSVSFSPDGNTLASGDFSGRVKLWDVDSANERATLQGHTGRVLSVAFSPDGGILATGSQDKTVKLWDVATEQELVTLRGHFWSVYSVTFSPDGRRLVSRDMSERALIWDIQRRQRVDEQLPQTTAPVTVSPDGELEVCCQGRLIHLLDRRWKPHLPPLFQPDPYWHREQLALAEKEQQPFAAAFHQSRLAGFEPWDASPRMKEAEAWARAGQNERAARAFVQAILLDPEIARRAR